jgi:phage terminase small subunit
MPRLPNIKHERFANEIVGGKSAAAAYAAAGYKADRRSAWRIRHDPDIVRRIEELIETEREQEKQAVAKAAVRFEVTADRVIGELAKIAFANISDVLRVGPDGEVEVNLEGCTRDELAAVRDISIEEYPAERDGKAQRRVRIKLADKRGALVDLGKYLGLFVEPSVNANILNYFSERPPTMEEWKREIEAGRPRDPADQAVAEHGALEGDGAGAA